MVKPACTRSKSRAAAICLVTASLLVVGAPGCAPEGADTIDMDASKALAAQKGIGPGAPKSAQEKKPNGQPLAAPAPPPQ